MIIQQFYLQCLAHASYLIVDESTGIAAVIDPQRDVAQYLEAADAHGARIQHVILTHFHADFVAGHIELRDRLGATIHLGAAAEAEFAFSKLADGDAITFGDVELVALETPGHTPEGISILAYDKQADDLAPKAVFTGDTLFVGDVGRPDLMASIGITAEELASRLYDSLHDKLMTLPDETVVYPAHGAGSMCGKNLSSETSSTIGAQRANNPSLQPMSKDDFVALVSANQPEAPRYFPFDAVLNRQDRAALDETLERALTPLDAEAFAALRDGGAQIVDVRDADAFAAHHVAGSMNVGLDGKFATWAGTVIDPDVPVVLVGDAGQEREAALRLGRIGLDGVAGYLDGGIDAAPEAWIATCDRMDATQLSGALGGATSPTLIDVRTPGEFDGGHIEGALHIPLVQLERRLDEVPDGPCVVVCRSGYRSSLAASLLRARGKTPVCDLAGGMNAWEQEDRPTIVVSSPSCGL